MPKISVLLPVYNGQQYLKEAVDSILAQTFTDFELILLDDCSTDATEQIIRTFTDERIVSRRNEHNMGISATLNRGIRMAKGEYIARMDADDLALAHRFQKQVDYLNNHPEIGVLGTWITTFGEGIENQGFHFPTDPDQLKAEALFFCPLAHPSVMIRKSVMQQGNLWYSEEFNGMEDHYLWWQVCGLSRISSLPETLLNYRMHPGQVTQQRSQAYYQKTELFIKERLEVFHCSISAKELSVFSKYCKSEAEHFTYEEVERYICFLRKLLKANRSTGYFRQSSLRRVFGQSVMSICKKSLSAEQSVKMWRLALKKRVLPLSIGVRWALRRQDKR